VKRETEEAVESALEKDGRQQRNRGTETTTEKRNKAGNLRINATLRGVRVTIVAMERQQWLSILDVCL
jgi:hypothetical protein